ncbi:thymidine phosphorylase [Paracoccus aminophilus]|uniref:Thymidine phosphorylase n=1 Tax=Paracoccus aminophilus JCM 7686 TaxID=1367847 RepID=S5YWI4_PARAH|nr:thymidine phosphorylase [Paracoccus aminophilus]AGT09551.1 thymidine phosphorylase [Paracoccus aminophilus JCM 7686]
MSDPRGVIAALRDGQGLDASGAALIARGLAEGTLSDAQAGAFAMAVLLRGTGRAGRIALTEAMRDSGRVLRWDLPGPVLDKHSTGGIGDTVSLILAPVLAAAGAFVPMISGRGLGHTGGTLDKLEAIPGCRVDLDEAALRRITAEVGTAIVAASGDLAPADRRLYAIRDESGTVESLDLITASILSKKLAAGLDGLVLDVKCGSGAFSRDLDTARDLARALVETANGAGCKTMACITDMDQPLAPAAGNALEIRAVLEAFRTGEGALCALALDLAGEGLTLAGIDPARASEAFASGRAAEIFGRMIAAQGGPCDLIERPDTYLGPAPVVRAVEAGGAGFVAAVDGTALGRAVVALGGGRVRASDRIDPRVGLSQLLRKGDQVSTGAPLALVHARSEAEAEAAAAQVRAAYVIGEAPAQGPLILERILA